MAAGSLLCRRMTLGPAQRLERFVPAMRTKGRISAGMDADLTVFDPGNFLPPDLA